MRKQPKKSINMEKRIMNYEAPEATVFGVETQNCFASGGVSSPNSLDSLNGYDTDWE